MSRTIPTAELIAGVAGMPDYGASLLVAIMEGADKSAAGMDTYAALGAYQYCAELAAGVIAHLAREQRGGAGIICWNIEDGHWRYFVGGTCHARTNDCAELERRYPAAVVMRRGEGENS